MQVTIDLVWSNITVIKNLKIHFATFVDGVLLKKKKDPTNKTNFIFVNNTVCVANSQKLDLSTKYMRYHDTKPPYFSTQYRLHSHAPQFKKNMHYFF